jgi:hypothetical protein
LTIIFTSTKRQKMPKSFFRNHFTPKQTKDKTLKYVLLTEDEELTKNNVGTIQEGLVHGLIADHTASLIESYKRWCFFVPKMIGYDLHPIMFPNCHAGVACSQIDPNHWTTLAFPSHCLQELTGKKENIILKSNEEISWILEEKDQRLSSTYGLDKF